MQFAPLLVLGCQAPAKQILPDAGGNAPASERLARSSGNLDDVPPTPDKAQPGDVSPVPTTTADIPATTPDTPCPAGMALVVGGVPTKEQQARWQRFYYAQEKSQAPAEVASFCLDIHETTEADYHKCGSNCAELRTKPPRLGDGSDSSQHPLVNVHWRHAGSYCASLGKRLPSLAEWLWAAGGGTEDRKYPWGSQAPSITRLNGCDYACARIKMGDCGGDDRDCTERKMAEVQGDDGYGRTAPVGVFPDGAGRWGQLDLAGNAAEIVSGVGNRVWWCGSTYDGYISPSLHAPQCVADGVLEHIDGMRCAAEPRLTDRR